MVGEEEVTDVTRKASHEERPPEGRELLTPGEVAEKLRVTAEQVRVLVRKGQLAAINVGTGAKRPLYRITPQALEEFLSRRWQPGPAVRARRRSSRRPAVPDLFPKLR